LHCVPECVLTKTIVSVIKGGCRILKGWNLKNSLEFIYLFIWTLINFLFISVTTCQCLLFIFLIIFNLNFGLKFIKHHFHLSFLYSPITSFISYTFNLWFLTRSKHSFIFYPTLSIFANLLLKYTYLLYRHTQIHIDGAEIIW
jgi:hypothetical protein